MSDLIADAIREYWGERCPDFEPGCPCCRAWIEYDEITRLRADNERLRAALKEIADFHTWEDISNEECMRDIARAALAAQQETGHE